MKKIISFLFLFVLCFMMVSCGEETEESKAIISAKLDKTTVKSEYVLSNFDLSSIELTVTYDDATSENIPATKEMLSTEDQEKITTEGIHNIVITYNNKEFKVKFTLLGDGKYIATLYNFSGDAYLKKTFNDNEFATLLENNNAPTEEGYIFVCWYYDELLEEEALSSDNKNENISLYPKYIMEEQTFTVKFVDCFGKTIDSQVVKAGQSAKEPTPTAFDTKKFVGWDKTFDKIFANTTVTALYEDIKQEKCNVTMQMLGLDQNQTSITEAVKGENLELATTFYGYEDYTFNGWFYDSSFTKPVGDTLLVTEDITIYGSFTKK